VGVMAADNRLFVEAVRYRRRRCLAPAASRAMSAD
jgi:hypothetical protein